MQGVFLRKALLDLEQLEESVAEAPERVLLRRRNEGRRSWSYVRVVNRHEAARTAQRESMQRMMGFGSSPEPLILVEDLRDGKLPSQELAALDSDYAFVRPKSKKELRESLARDAAAVWLEATSAFGNDYGGSLEGAPRTEAYYVVGPDPHRKRSWFASIEWSDDRRAWRLR